jgi:hypothetical protein
MELFVNDEAGDFDTEVRFQKLGERAVNPAEQAARVRFGDEDSIIGTGKQTSKPCAHRVIGRGISELFGEPGYLGAILLAGLADGMSHGVGINILVNRSPGKII